jgi:hypothetical protein
VGGIQGLQLLSSGDRRLNSEDFLFWAGRSIYRKTHRPYSMAESVSDDLGITRFGLAFRVVGGKNSPLDDDRDRHRFSRRFSRNWLATC